MVKTDPECSDKSYTADNVYYLITVTNSRTAVAHYDFEGNACTVNKLPDNNLIYTILFFIICSQGLLFLKFKEFVISAFSFVLILYKTNAILAVGLNDTQTSTECMSCVKKEICIMPNKILVL